MDKSVVCKDVFGNQYKVSVSDLDFRVGVYAIIIEDDKILLTRQWNGFSLIGGTVEKGETLEESLIRETKEETGLSIVPGKLFYHATTFFKRDKDTKARESVQLYFTHSRLSGKIENHMLTNK